MTDKLKVLCLLLFILIAVVVGYRNNMYLTKYSNNETVIDETTNVVIDDEVIIDDVGDTYELEIKESLVAIILNFINDVVFGAVQFIFNMVILFISYILGIST